MRLVACLFLTSQLIGCSSRGPTLLVSVENIPPQALSLSTLATHTMDSTVLASIDALHPYDLPQPAAAKSSFLLRLPDNFSGEIAINVAAMKQAGGQGCLLRAGTTSRVFMPSPLDDTVVVSLKNPDTADSVCMGQPRIFSAAPRFGRTDGNQVITLSGWGFVPGADVYFGDVKAPAVQYTSATSLQVTTPASTVFGPVAIKVVNSSGAQAVANNIFQYAYETVSFTGLPSQTIAPDMMTDFTVQRLGPSTDMYPDFVYTTTKNQLITVLFPQLSGDTYDLSTPLSNLSLFDINKDGSLDVALGLPMMNQATVLVNGGQGTLAMGTPTAAGMKPAGIGTGDLDGDGYPEMVVANQVTPPAMFSVLMNNKQGALGAPTAYTLPSSSLVTQPLLVGLLDLNGDNKPDIIIADAVAPQAMVFFNQGGGIFDTAAQPTGYFVFNLDGPATQILPFDIDGDGRLDLVIPQESKDEVLITLSTDHLAFNLSKISTKSPRKVTFGDVNGDGLADLVVMNSSAYAVDIFVQQRRVLPADPLFLNTPSVSMTLASVGNLIQVGVTDFPPADGKIDIVVAGVQGFAILSNNSH